jgi:hypothetical protein
VEALVPVRQKVLAATIALELEPEQREFPLPA